MAELLPGNFVNPQYATPEQLATQRAYAAALMKRSGEPVNRPAGAFANMIDAITGGLTRNNADTMQNEAAARNSADLRALISQLQAGKVDPATAAQIYANPMASPEHRALIGGLVAPQKVEDVAGRPGYASPSAGVQAAPVAGTFQPGFRAPETAGSVSTVTPIAAPMPQQRPPVPSGPRVWGDKEAQAAGLYPSPAPPPGGGGGPQAPVSGPPAGAAPAVTFDQRFSGSRIDQLAAKDRELSAEKARTEGGAGGEAAVIKQDVAAAADAPNVLKGVGTIKDNILKYGDSITFGPTSPWSLEMKRVAANYAPGFMKNHLEAIAAADSINKVGIGLAGVLASQLQGGNNAETFAKSMQGVPGLTTSKEGALAMADMIQQSAMKSQQLGGIYSRLAASNGLKNYQAEREKFLTDNPVVNPLTGRPIEMDIKAAREAEKAAKGATGGPAIGTIVNGYRFKGGNPNDRNSWEPVT